MSVIAEQRRCELPPTDDAVGALQDLDDLAFERVVCDNVFAHNRDADTWGQLLSAECVRRSYDTLRRGHDRNSRAVRRRRDDWERFAVDCVVTPISRQEWLAAQREYEDWRRRAANFATAVQGALREVRHACRQITRDARRGDHNPQFNRGQLRELALAIYCHRTALIEGDVIAEAHDQELWRTLETVTVPHGRTSEPTSLLTMLDERHWS